MYRYNEWISASMAHHNMSELDRFAAARNQASLRNRATGPEKASDASRRPNGVRALLGGWFVWTRAIVK